jgi:hypothetical protein
MMRAMAKTWDFMTVAMPNKLKAHADLAAQAGDALCYGKRAPKTIVPGMVLRGAARLAAVSMGHRWTKHAIPLTVAAGLAAAFTLAPVSIGMAAMMLAGAPVAMIAASGLIAGAAALAGAVAALPPALCSISCGFSRRAEVLEKEEEERQRAIWEARRQLPPLDRDFEPYREDLEKAEPHARLRWLEALKAKFPREFAAAALPQAGEPPPAPPPVPAPKAPAGKWQALRRAFHF